MSGYFCSESIFNLSNWVLTDVEIKVLEKGLNFAPIKNKLNETELRSDFNEFCRRLRLKCHFRNESENFSELSVSTPKSRWQPPQGHPFLEAFLSQVEDELFEELKMSFISRAVECYKIVRSWADDRNIIIKRADKGLCIVIWGANDYLMKAEKQLCDKKDYEEVNNSENYLSKQK